MYTYVFTSRDSLIHFKYIYHWILAKLNTIIDCRRIILCFQIWHLIIEKLFINSWFGKDLVISVCSKEILYIICRSYCHQVWHAVKLGILVKAVLAMNNIGKMQPLILCYKSVNIQELKGIMCHFNNKRKQTKVI